jgi:hypothetical protein
MNREDEERLYAEQMGREALLRQKAPDICKTCWQPKDNHHPACYRGRRQAQEQQNPRRKRG